MPTIRLTGLALFSIAVAISSPLTASSAVLAREESAPSPTAVGADNCDNMDCCREYVGASFLQSQDALFAFNGVLQRSPLLRAGYAGTVDDAESKTAVVYWRGEVPTELDLDALAAKFDITAKVREWPVDRNTLDTAALALARSLTETPVAGFDISSAGGFDGEFAGLRVSGRDDTADTAAISALIAKRAEQFSSLPIRLEYAASGNLSGRYQDSSPYAAGDLMRSSSLGSCSTGFAVLYGTINKTTTARHCKANDYVAYDNSSTTYGGTVTNTNEGQTRMLVGRGRGYVFDGTTLSSTASERVADYVYDAVGDRICSDGGIGGLHCNLLVDLQNATFYDGTGSTEYVDRAYRTSTGASTIQGDSGGPVLMPIANSSTVHAIGTIQGYTDNTTNLQPNCGLLPK